MSYSWTVTGAGFNTDGEPQDAHPLSCPLWASSDPATDCDCGSFEAGVLQLMARIESYAVPAAEHADGAA